jgi:hypothetical protein
MILVNVLADAKEGEGKKRRESKRKRKRIAMKNNLSH